MNFRKNVEKQKLEIRWKFRNFRSYEEFSQKNSNEI